MASTQSWTEWNIVATAYTATTARSEANWKRIDDSTTAYTASPINATNNENSNPKHQAILFGGTYGSLSALSYKINTAAVATGCNVYGAVLTAKPTQATAGAPNSTLATGDSLMSTSGINANFTNTTDGYATGTTTYSTAGGVYGNVLRTQLQMLSTYAGGPGDINSGVALIITASWTES